MSIPQRDDLMHELLDVIERGRVAVAMALVLHEQTGRSHFHGAAISSAEIEDFVRSLSVRQLRKLRTIALSLELSGEGRVH